MPTNFLHGVEVIFDDTQSRPIRTLRSSVIGIVGTAPDADDAAFPLNQPVLLTNRQEFATIGEAGTLPPALNQIYDQAGAVVVLVRVEEGADVRKNVIGGVNPVTSAYEGLQALRAAKSAVGFAPKLLVAPGFTSDRSSNGILTIPVAAGGDGYTVPPVVTITDATGEGAKATAVLTADAVSSIVIDDPGEGYTAPVVTIAAPPAGTQATADTATLGPVRSRVVSQLLGVAEALSAVIIMDGPSTTDAAAVQMADDFGSPRIYAHDPNHLRLGVSLPASPAIAGLINKVDHEKGFWHSPSNHEFNGVEGTSRAIDFELGDTTSRANLLNELKIATTIREQGVRLWGNQTLSSDPQYKFLSVVRTADMVAESIKQNHLWAVDRCITSTFIQQVVDGVKAYLRSLQERGAILGGDAWFDPALNTANEIKNGNVKISYHFTPCYPAERVTFIASITDAYITNLFL
ncbi:MAG: phage tail sheath C-terminal domain-containing protein [Cyanobacteria bacterium J06638_7]